MHMYIHVTNRDNVGTSEYMAYIKHSFNISQDHSQYIEK